MDGRGQRGPLKTRDNTVCLGRAAFGSLLQTQLFCTFFAQGKRKEKKMNGGERREPERISGPKEECRERMSPF